jgi:hypothetical protein
MLAIASGFFCLFASILVIYPHIPTSTTPYMTLSQVSYYKNTNEPKFEQLTEDKMWVNVEKVPIP